MRKKMKFPFLSKSSERWRPWPGCAMAGHLRTMSFRGDNGDGGIFKIINSAYNVECDSSTASYEQLGSDCVEKVIRGLRSERLIFKPEETSSFVASAGGGGGGENFPLKESVAVVVESTDPISDFKRSMEEMVEAHDGFKDWEFLEELLICYLRMNGKSTHGYIVGAFVDLLVGLSFHSSSSPAAASEADTAAATTELDTTVVSSSSSSSSDEQCLLSSSTTNNHSFTSYFSFTSSASCSSAPYFSKKL